MTTEPGPQLALGVDIGGTGIKGAVVDVASGELVSDRIKVATPDGGEPEDVIRVVAELVERLASPDDGVHDDVDLTGVPLGVCFPAVVADGRTLTAANVSDAWIGLEAEKLFEAALGRDIVFVNDADAAGVAEARFGAAKDVPGLVILTTLGTGIGSALLQDGVLVRNTELGHLRIRGRDAEHRAAYSVKERKKLSWKRWAGRLQEYYRELERLFHPRLFVIGGGVSKKADEFLPLIDVRTPMVPAAQLNNAGILGAAWLAARR